MPEEAGEPMGTDDIVEEFRRRQVRKKGAESPKETAAEAGVAPPLQWTPGPEPEPAAPAFEEEPRLPVQVERPDDEEVSWADAQPASLSAPAAPPPAAPPRAATAPASVAPAAPASTAASATRPAPPVPPLLAPPPPPAPPAVAMAAPESDAPASDAPPASWDEAKAVTLPLGAANEELGLQARLVDHAFLAPRGSPRGRALGLLVTVLGLLAVAADRRFNALGDGPVLLGGTGAQLWHAGAVLVVAGLLLWLLCSVGRRRVQIEPEVTQEQEWLNVGQAVRRHAWLRRTATALALLGAALLVVAYGVPGWEPDVRIAAAGALLLVAGAVLGVRAWGRARTLRHLYLQTLVLTWVESSGIVGGEGRGLDARVVRVLHSLDRLLASLPDAMVREFLLTPAGREYLALMEEVRGEPSG